jgi:hypothetical protein
MSKLADAIYALEALVKVAPPAALVRVSADYAQRVTGLDPDRITKGVGDALAAVKWLDENAETVRKAHEAQGRAA